MWQRKGCYSITILQIYIKNMVCNRCIMVVKSELEQFGLHPVAVELGEVTLDRTLTQAEKKNLDERLQQLGFEIIDDKKTRLIESIRTRIIDMIYSEEEVPKLRFSEQLSDEFHHEYSYLSKLFSEVRGTTLEQFIIRQKIERVKELLVYGELSLSEIAYKLGYSSVSHLSKQFKKVTGLTPTYFKEVRKSKRLPLDKL